MTLTHPATSGNRLPPNLIAGVTMGVLTVIVSVTFGAVIFSGELAAALPFGIGLMLLSSTVVSAIVASLSAYPAVVAAVPDTTMPVLALVARQIVDMMPDASFEAKLMTVTAAIMLNALARGLVFLALGWFHLGGFIRFIPYPVVGGFLGGTGVLLVQSAFQPLSGVDLHQLGVLAFFQPAVLLQWIPGLVCALALLVVPRYIEHFLVMPGLIVGAIALFYLGLGITGTSIEQAGAQGLLLGELPAGGLFSIPTVPALTHANWNVLFQQMPNLAALWLIESIALLLSATGIELMAARDLNLSHELKVAGMASIASGVSGGGGGFHVLGDTILARQLGGTSRLVGWSIAAICLGILLGGASVLSLFPTMIVVGIALLQGLDFLHEWLYRAWFKFSRADFALILLIVLITATVGYLQGIGVGLLAATILFVINYSRLSVTKRVASGAFYHSNVLWTPEETHLLRDQGKQIYILELQGLIFFGTANKLLSEVRDHVNVVSQPIRFVVLDFRLVSDLDSSAVLSFTKLRQFAQERRIHLLFTHLSATAIQRLQQGGLLASDDALCHVFPDLDRGLEWCERQILQPNLLPQHQQEGTSSLAKQLETSFGRHDVVRLLTYLKPRALAEGEYLFRQGDPFDGLYFVGVGQVSVVLELGEGQTKRIRTYSTGNSIGEMGLYRKAPRMASVVADKPSEVYLLTTEAFEHIEATEPLLATRFHRFIVNLLAERLYHREEELQHLLQ